MSPKISCILRHWFVNAQESRSRALSLSRTFQLYRVYSQHLTPSRVIAFAQSIGSPKLGSKHDYQSEAMANRHLGRE